MRAAGRAGERAVPARRDEGDLGPAAGFKVPRGITEDHRAALGPIASRMKGTQTVTKIRLTGRTNRRDFEEHTDFRQCLLGELIPAASHDNAGRYPLLQGEYCTVRIPAGSQ